MQIEPLTLSPDRGKAAGWTLMSLGVIALGIWLVQDASGERVAGPVTWVTLGIMIAVSTWFVLQTAAPNLFEVHIEPTGIRARAGWQKLDLGWDQIESASIRMALGEPYLRLVVIDEVEGGWISTPTAVPLPLGVDIPELRMALARARAAGRVGMESFTTTV